MDPMVQRKIEQIDQQLAGLRETLEKSRAELALQHQEKEEMLQEQWRNRKKMTALDRVSKEYDALQAENRRYAKERKQLREQLARLLTLTKSLRNSFRA
jgi:cell division septum initiation protein DivIVA